MKYILYAFFFALPFANKPIAGHIYPIEIPLLLGLLFLPFSPNLTTTRLNALDVLMFAYAVFGLLSVVVGMHSLYESARHYRLMVLTPVLLYVFIRFCPFLVRDIQKALFFILPGAFWQGVLLLNYYLVFGERPVNVEGAASTITLSIIFTFSLAVLIFGFSQKPGFFVRVIRYVLIAVFLVMLLVSFTRAALVVFILLAPITTWIWSARKRRILLGRTVFGATLGLLFMIFTGAVIYSGQAVENERETQRSAERLLDIDLYLKDISARVAFWGRLTQSALENPILGSGADRHKIGRSGGTDFNIGSAHNILISTLITTGVIGLLIFLSVVFLVYRAFGSFPENHGEVDAIGKVLLLTLTVLLFVAFTNDFSGGRVFIWYSLLALASRLSMEKVDLEKTGIMIGDDSANKNHRILRVRSSVDDAKAK